LHRRSKLPGKREELQRLTILPASGKNKNILQLIHVRFPHLFSIQYAGISRFRVLQKPVERTVSIGTEKGDFSALEKSFSYDNLALAGIGFGRNAGMIKF
jgi:hypothetical protein